MSRFKWLLILLLPGPLWAGEFSLAAGVMPRSIPRTTGNYGYGNHGLYGTRPSRELNSYDRRHANWDAAPGLFLESETGVLRTIGRVKPALYGRAMLVDTEYNETQANWTYLSGVAGLRIKLELFRGGTAFAGLGAGLAHAANRGGRVVEYEYGLGLGPLRIFNVHQSLWWGRELRHDLAVGLEFPLGGEEAPESGYYYGFSGRVCEYPGRKVKNINKGGFLFGKEFPGGSGGPVFVELEAMLAPVESNISQPLSGTATWNYRTQDEIFWGAYLGRAFPFKTFFSELRMALGAELYHQDDGRVNPKEECGWFGGARMKISGTLPLGGGISLRPGLLGGYGSFGADYGVELGLSRRL